MPTVFSGPPAGDGLTHIERDAINPPHYGSGTYETINVIEAWGLGFCLGNAVKYISRAGKKGSRLEDLKKARWYLEREIGNEQRSAR